MTIDVVDFSAPNASERFAESLHNTGFGVIKNHPISNELVDKAYREWAEFFTRNEKNDYMFTEESQAGYFPPSVSEVAKGNTIKDIKEYFHYYPWGPCPDYLRADAETLIQQLTQLSKTLLGFIDDNLPQHIKEHLSMPLSQMLEGSERILLRILNYPALTGNEPEGALRAAEHTDINLITLLPAATAEGLQAKTKSGEWVDVPINKNWIIINAGDMLQEATDGFIPSTYHRVINPTGEAAKEARLSMPLFQHPNHSVRLSDRHTAASYWEERLKEIGVKK